MDQAVKPPKPGAVPGKGRDVAPTNIMPDSSGGVNPPSFRTTNMGEIPANMRTPRTVVRQVGNERIVDNSGPSAADFLPPNYQPPPEGTAPQFTPEQIQQFGQNAQNVNDRGMRMLGMDPLSDPLHPGYRGARPTRAQTNNPAPASTPPAPASTPPTSGGAGEGRDVAPTNLMPNGLGRSTVPFGASQPAEKPQAAAGIGDLARDAAAFAGTIGTSSGLKNSTPSNSDYIDSTSGRDQYEEQGLSSGDYDEAAEAGSWRGNTPAPSPTDEPTPLELTRLPDESEQAPDDELTPLELTRLPDETPTSDGRSVSSDNIMPESAPATPPAPAAPAPATPPAPAAPATGEAPAPVAPATGEAPASGNNTVGNNMGMGNWAGRQAVVSGVVAPAMNKQLVREGAKTVAGQGVKGLLEPWKNMATGGGQGWAGRVKAVGDYGKSWLPGVTEGSAAGKASLNAANAGKAVHATARGGRILNTLNAARAAGAAGGAAGTTAAGIATALPAVGVFSAGNAALELVDAAGALPQWAGGTGFLAPKSWGGSGTDAFGWDQKGFERQTMNQGALGNFGSGMMNPLKATGEIAKGVGELGSSAYDAVTDAKGRATKKNISDTQALHRSEAANLGQQAAKLQQSGNLADPAVKAQYDELLAKANDAKQQALAIADETADWNLGNQHYFGSGGHKFRDAMQSSGDAMKKELAQLQSGRNALAADDPRLENLRSRQQETQRMVDLYGKEVGYTGEGDFTKVVRSRVATGKSRIIDIAARMREPAVRNNPELMAQLSQDLEHQKARMQNYQQWGAAAR